MSKTYNFVLAGFGGQGLLFSGKVIAYSGLIDDKEVSWLPSYGPEMRGGTANCSVIVSDEPVGSPMIQNPDVLVALNLPSFKKFEQAVAPDGIMVIDSSLVEEKTARTDVKAFYIPATQLAQDNDLRGLANMIALGKVLKETGFATMETLEKALAKCIPPKKAAMLEKNLKAIQMGYNL